LLLICCTLPKHFKFPLTIMLILVERASASSIECVVKIMLDLFLKVDILLITFHMNLLASGSIPVEGSSKNTIGGFPSIAIATESFLLLPPLYVPAQIFSYFLRFISCNCFSTSCSLLINLINFEMR